MRIRIKLVFVAAVLLLSGCATAYQPDGISGGYSDRRLSDNTAQVTFRGNRFDTPEMLHSYLLRRCADVTLQNGYEYFVLAGSGAPNEQPTYINDQKDDYEFTASATIEMFKGIKPAADARAYDAKAVVRSVPVELGEAAETQAPPPVAVVAAGRMPVVNPNAPTHEPQSFEHF
jgi:hypothetical protein